MKNINYFNLIIFFAVIIITAVVYLIFDVSRNILFADEWDTPGNILVKFYNGEPLAIADFFSQHNESRKAFPKLLYILLAKFGILDMRVGVWIRLILSFLSIFLIYISSKSLSKNKRIVFMVCSSILIFIPSQTYNLVFGLQFITIVPSFCLIICILILESKLSIYVKFLLNFSLCIISTFTYANGMIVWAIASPFLFYFYRPKKEIKNSQLFSLLFTLLSFVIIGIYFYNYKSPPSHPGIIEGITDPIRSFHFFLLWIWSPFLSGLTNPKLACLLLALFHLSIVFFFGKELKLLILRKVSLNTFQYLMICLILYGLGTGLTTALGRSGFGIKAALYVQYPSFALWIHIGILGLLLSLQKELFSKINIIFLTIYGTLFTVSFEDSITKLYSWKNTFTQASLCVNYIDIFPSNPVLQYMHPSPELIPKKTALFKKNSLIKETENQWIIDQNVSIKSSGGFFSISITSGTIMINGWACNAETKKPADFVVLFDHSLDGKKIPILLTNLDKERKDVSKVLGIKNINKYGFHHHLPFKGKLLFPEMYAVDLKTKTLFRLEKIN
jgi:hypothetical protein